MNVIVATMEVLKECHTNTYFKSGALDLGFCLIGKIAVLGTYVYKFQFLPDVLRITFFFVQFFLALAT